MPRIVGDVRSPRRWPSRTRTVGKRHPLNMRTTSALRERLEAAAIANGRSLAQEVELRLEQSFREDYAAYGGAETAAVLRMMAALAVQVETRTGDPWTRHRKTELAVR